MKKKAKLVYIVLGVFHLFSFNENVILDCKALRIDLKRHGKI